MVAIIVDGEFMENNIVKELGIFHNGESIGLSLLPPHDYKQLTERERQQNMWLTRNYHYITWNEGKHSYESLPKLLDIHGPFESSQRVLFETADQA